MTVAAHDGLPRLSDAKLRTNHVDDTLLFAAEPVELYAELGAIRGELGDLIVGFAIRRRREYPRRCRNRMVCRSQRQVRASNTQAALSQLVESLGRGDFVDQVQIDKENRGRIRFRNDDV